MTKKKIIIYILFKIFFFDFNAKCTAKTYSIQCSIGACGHPGAHNIMQSLGKLLIHYFFNEALIINDSYLY